MTRPGEEQSPPFEQQLLDTVERTLGSEAFQRLLLNALARSIARRRLTTEAYDQLLEMVETEAALTNSITTLKLPERAEERMDAIIGSIQHSGVVGRLPEGAQIKTGTLPAIATQFKEWSDYTMHASQPGTLTNPNTRSSLLSIGEIFAKEAQGNPGGIVLNHHIMAFLALKRGRGTAVDYLFWSADSEGEHPQVVQFVAIMPNTEAEQLRELVKDWPDIAELYFQQAANGLERTRQNLQGVERLQCDKIAVVELDRQEDEAQEALAILLAGDRFSHELSSALRQRGVSTIRKYSQLIGTLEKPS